MKLAILLAILSTGCATLPPHDWIRLKDPGVDLFWWTDQQQCDLRVVFFYAPDEVRGFTVRNVDPALCGRKP